MLPVFLLLLGVVIPLFCSCVTALRVATWNLRYDSQSNSITVQESLDSLPSPLTEPSYLGISTGSEQPWSTRRIRVAQYLKSRQIDLVGIQEGLVRQVNDLQELLGDSWAHVGVGRDDGKQSGEYSAIFWNKDILNLAANETFWLSETPLEPSKYPGAGSVRLATYARFHAGDSSKNVTFLNSHFDDQSNDQRMLGASMLLTRAKYEAVNSGGAVIVMGDFNSPPTGNSSEGYSIITGSRDLFSPINATWAAQYSVPDTSLPDFVMQDLRGEVDPALVSETFATFTGFTAPNNPSQWKRIDFVFGGSNGNFDAQSYFVEDVRCDDGLLMSDHRPTIVDIAL